MCCINIETPNQIIMSQGYCEAYLNQTILFPEAFSRDGTNSHGRTEDKCSKTSPYMGTNLGNSAAAVRESTSHNENLLTWNL